jgi:hypothetical protein
MAHKNTLTITVWKGKDYAMLLLIILLVGVLCAWFWTSMDAPNQTKKPSATTTTAPITYPFKPMDYDLMFGTNNENDYLSHNFNVGTCGRLVNEQGDVSRDIFIYVSNCYVDFDMLAYPNKTNVLVFTVLHYNAYCRHNDVYVDGLYVGSLDKQGVKTYESDNYNWILENPSQKDFMLNFTTTKSMVNVRIDDDMQRTSCGFGNDISRIKVVEGG